nr:GILT-like protein 1 [Dermacentor andersoni]
MGAVSLCCLLLLGLLPRSPCLAQTKPETAVGLYGNPVQKVNVTVMYEPYCKDSSWFITKQLFPVYGLLRKHLVVEMVPFGRTRMKEPQGADTTVSFTCRHGQAECHASMIHACAIDLYPDTDMHLPFIACTLKEPKPEKNVRTCSNEHKLESSKISDCVESPLGKILLQKMGWRTTKVRPPMNSVPSVLIDGEFQKRYQKKLQRKFKEAVCEHFKPPFPKPCVVKGWFSR